MDLSALQKLLAEFEQSRGWDRFPASQVFVHLIEELGEISRFITIEEGYKILGIGHEAHDDSNLSREFAQALNLFIQLANHFNVDLETSVLSEIEIMEKRFPADEWKKRMEKR